MRPVGWVLVLCVAGCGRSGFDTIDAPHTTGDGSVDPFDAPAGAIVATFGDTPGATYPGVTFDTYILSDGGSTTTFNYGASPTLTMESSQKRVLLRFDTSAIPTDKTLAAARVHISINYAESGSCTIALAPVLESWTEGAQSGTAGVANWTERTASQSWTTVGAGSPGSSGELLASGSGSVGQIIGIDVPVATAQGWVNAPASNFGLALTTSGGSECRIDSRESATATNRPELVVTYFP